MTEHEVRLLERAQGGDMDAFAALFEPMRSTFVRVAAEIAGDADAEDIVMDALLRVWKALPAFRQSASVRTWAIRIVRNGALDSLRSRTRRREVPLERESDDGDGTETIDLPDSRTVHPGDAMGAAETRGEVVRALGHLEGVHRRALELRYMDELSYSEIAAATGVSIGTVMSRLFYAKRKLAKWLEVEAAAAEAGTSGSKENEA